MDAFEAATQFSQILRSLTPAVQNLTRAAHFALKHLESEDYLFPSILDILNDASVELNTKSTIFQFIEVLFNESFYYSRQPKFNYPYVQNLKKALPQIILAVLPETNNSNIFNVYASLKNITKHFKVDCDIYVEKFNHSLLEDEDIKNAQLDVPFPPVKEEDAVSPDPIITSWDLLVKKKKQSQYERLRLLTHSTTVTETVPEDKLFAIKDKQDRSTELLSKKQILARMEDDREAHKRSKENLWVVTRPKDISYLTEEEFLNQYWDKTTKLSDAEDKIFLGQLEELNKVVALSYKDQI